MRTAVGESKSDPSLIGKLNMQKKSIFNLFDVCTHVLAKELN